MFALLQMQYSQTGLPMRGSPIPSSLSQRVTPLGQNFSLYLAKSRPSCRMCSEVCFGAPHLQVATLKKQVTISHLDTYSYGICEAIFFKIITANGGLLLRYLLKGFQFFWELLITSYFDKMVWNKFKKKKSKGLRKQTIAYTLTHTHTQFG